MLVDLTDKRALDSSLAGGKGATLAALLAKDFPVPEGFVITTSAFAVFMEEAGLETEIPGLLADPLIGNFDELQRAVKPIADRIRISHLPNDIAKGLEEKLDEYAERLGAETFWAVRSSALAEDLQDASFAGQYDSFLGLKGFDEISAAILKCFASFFNPHAVQYKLNRGIDEFLGAVVVQRLICADSAGVCFTLDPVTGDTDSIVINSNFGLGESIVSGRVRPDTFVIERAGRGLRAHDLGTKHIKIVPGPGGVMEESLEESLRLQPSLTDRQAVAVAELAIRVEESEGRPVDIEWAFADENLYLLQSRPITGRHKTIQASGEAPPNDWIPELNTTIDPQYPLYSNGNISEVLPGCITPLSWSYVGPEIEHSFRAQGIALGAMDKGGPEFRVLGFFFHRPYICVSYLEEAATRTPGMSPDMIHEEFLGLPTSSTPPLSLGDFRPDRLPALGRVALVSLYKMLSLDRDTHKCVETMNRQREESTPEKLKKWSDEKLIDEVRFSGEKAWLSVVHVWASSFAVVNFSLLRKLTERWLGDAEGSLAAQLVTGIDSLPSADPAFALYDLAEKVKSSPTIMTLFESHRDNHDIYSALSKGDQTGDFHEALNSFLANYGHRAVCEAEFRNPCWREDPAQVVGLIRNYIRGDSAQPKEVRRRQESVRAEAARQLEALSAPKRFIIRRVLKASRRYIALRELLKDLIVLRSDRARRIYEEIRNRLLARGLLNDPDDIYFLLWREVNELVSGSLDSARAEEIVSRRRRGFEWCQQVHVPKIQEGVARLLTAEDLPDNQALRGMGVSPGKVEGCARVILDPREGSHIEPGEILVAPVTDAGWTPLFIHAAGLVVEVGGLLSHGSVVAREYGLPAVVGVAGATKQIKTGDKVYLDGGSGTVIKLG